MRGLTDRPSLLVDERGRSIVDPNAAQIGPPNQGPISYGHMVAALPSKDGPRLIQPARVMGDSDGGYLTDPDGNIIGDVQQIWVSRIVMAARSPNTRRI
jgi:hypothetical protein